MRASGADRFNRTTYFETASALMNRRRHVRGDREAPGRRRVVHVLDGVDDVVRRQLLAVVELHALAQVEEHRLLALVLPRRRERRLDVQPLVELGQRVVGVLLAPVRRSGRHPVRRDGHRVGLEPEDEPPAAADLRRCERVLRSGGRPARQRACSDRSDADRARLGEQVATAEPVPFLGLGRFLCHVRAPPSRLRSRQGTACPGCALSMTSFRPRSLCRVRMCSTRPRIGAGIVSGIDCRIDHAPGDVKRRRRSSEVVRSSSPRLSISASVASTARRAEPGCSATGCGWTWKMRSGTA